jgi:hypothetical protein
MLMPDRVNPRPNRRGRLQCPPPGGLVVRLRKFIPPVLILVFIALTLVGANFVRLRLLERAMSAARGDARESAPPPWRGSIFDDSMIAQGSLINQTVRGLLGTAAYEKTTVAEHILGDFNRNGGREIIAAIERNCTGDPVDIVVLFWGKEAVRAQVIETHQGNLKRDVRDLNKDGKVEIITWSVLAESICHADCVVWPSVYEFEDGKGLYVDASAKYLSYYKKEVRPALEKRLADRKALNSDELDKDGDKPAGWWKQHAIADIYVALDKVSRLLGEDPKAGYDRAVSWVKDGDSGLRNNAIQVFSEIGDAPSIGHLKALALDKDAPVSLRAKRALTILATGKTK